MKSWFDYAWDSAFQLIWVFIKVFWFVGKVIVADRNEANKDPWNGDAFGE